MKHDKLWKVTYSKETPASKTFYVIAEDFHHAVAFGMAAIKQLHPPQNPVDDILDDLAGMLVEQVDDLLYPRHSVEIRTHDKVPVGSRTKDDATTADEA